MAYDRATFGYYATSVTTFHLHQSLHYDRKQILRL